MMMNVNIYIPILLQAFYRIEPRADVYSLTCGLPSPRRSQHREKYSIAVKHNTTCLWADCYHRHRSFQCRKQLFIGQPKLLRCTVLQQ